MVDYVEQARNGLSDPIAEYLHLRFTQLLPLILRWAGQINQASAVDAVPASDVAALIGQAAELAIGIDLAGRLPEPAAWLAEPDARRLLELAVRAQPDGADPPASGLLAPADDEELAQRLVRLAQTKELMFRLESAGPADRERARRFIDDLHHPQLFSCAPGWRYLRPVLDAYFSQGRCLLRALGTTAVVGHRFADGFAVCDIVVGNALIDIKCVTEPVSHLIDWIHQLLRYALLDSADELGIRRAGIYLARHAVLLAEPIDALLVELTGDTEVTLAALREEFEQVAAPQIAAFAAMRVRAHTPNTP
jgi:hypothetical protein